MQSDNTHTAFTGTKWRNIRFCLWLLLIRGCFLSSYRSHISLHLLNERIPGKRFRINHFTVHNTVLRKLFPDRGGINIVQRILCFWHFLQCIGRFRRFRRCFRFRICNRLICKTRDRHRQLLSGQSAAHLIQLLSFRIIQIVSAFNQPANMLLHSRPAQLHFLLKAPTAQAKTLTVVIHKAGGAVQVGVTVPTNSVFLFQEFLRCLG